MNEKQTRRAFRIAARVLMEARRADGWEYITLEYLYSTLGATSKVAQNGVLFARQDAMDDELIAKSGTRAVYRFV